MVSNRFRGKLVLVGLVFTSCLIRAGTASANMIFYYDPDSGNVSFDSSQTPSGGTFSYMLSIDREATNIRFRTENAIRLSDATLRTNKDYELFEGSLSEFFSGLYTLGNVLPEGLSEQTWQKLFATARYPHQIIDVPGSLGHHNLQYEIGLGGTLRELAQFEYGLPSGEFVNRLELVDPESLDWAEAVSLVYVPNTGEVQIETAGHFTAVRLKSDGMFLPENFTQFVDTPFVLADANQIVVLAGLIEPGRHSLGRVLPANLSASSLQSALGSAAFVARSGFNGGEYDFNASGVVFSLQIVPEPTTFAIAMIAPAIALTCRRRLAL